MENRSFYNEILTEHNLHPEFKHDLPDADIVLEGVNPSCGDDIFLKLKLDGDVIADGAFVGDGCAISQASLTAASAVSAASTSTISKVTCRPQRRISA